MNYLIQYPIESFYVGTDSVLTRQCERKLALKALVRTSYVISTKWSNQQRLEYYYPWIKDSNKGPGSSIGTQVVPTV